MSHRPRFFTPFVAALFVAVLAPATGAAASTGSGWRTLSARLPAFSAGQPLATGALAQRGFELDRRAFERGLAAVPLENTRAADRSLPVIAIPGPDGTLHRFRFVESPVMEPGLAKKVSFRSFAASGVDDPTASARFDYSAALGFHATVRSDGGAWRVDPAYRNDRVRHVAYRGRMAVDPRSRSVEQQATEARRAARGSRRSLPTPGALVDQRVYRLALANDPPYAAAVGPNVDVEKAAVVNRVNQPFNDDMAIKLVLVANNDLLNLDTDAKFTGTNGPCGAAACFVPMDVDMNPVDLTGCSPTKIQQTHEAIKAIIGIADFDIGHILDVGTGGGIAALASAGQDAIKGAGCSGEPRYAGDLLAIEFFAHELGHQFGATHVYNSTSCGGLSAESSSEPGSGSSIMSYAGVCGDDNVQAWSDPYFSQTSINQMQTHVRSSIPGATNGGTVVATTNHSPVPTVDPAQAIPPRTPFTLTGQAPDADDGDAPVFIWQQTDLGAAKALFSNTKPDGPLFGQFSVPAVVPTYGTERNAPGESVATAAGRIRTFPDLPQIAAGNTNAETGTCPIVTPATPAQIDCFAEFLPTTSRTLHFSLTARDLFPTGGGVSAAETVVTVAGTQPFRVTAPAAPASVLGNRDFALTWDVAGTTAAPVSVQAVRVLYSTDGGLTFPTQVVASTPNDGSETVLMPNTATTTGRFKVEAIGQPFFDISHANITVTPAEPLPPPVITPPVIDPPVIDPPVTTPPVTTPPAQFTVFRPVLTALPTRVQPSTKGTLRLKLSCVPVNALLAAPASCDGRLRLKARLRAVNATIANATFKLPAGRSKTISITLSAAARTALRTRSLTATATATVGKRTAKRTVLLRALR